MAGNPFPVTPLADRLGLGNRELVSLVGGGGKSSLLFALGNELAAAGRRVILTTTTKMGWEQALAAPTICWSADTACAVEALDRPGVVMLLTAGDGHKVTGPPPEIVDRLFAESNADFVIVEADGSKGKPLKAPASFEPVVPSVPHSNTQATGWNRRLRSPDWARIMCSPPMIAFASSPTLGEP